MTLTSCGQKISCLSHAFSLISHKISNTKYKLRRQFIQLSASYYFCHYFRYNILLGMLFSATVTYVLLVTARESSSFDFILLLLILWSCMWFETFRRIVLLPSSQKVILPWIWRQHLRNPTYQTPRWHKPELINTHLRPCENFKPYTKVFMKSLSIVTVKMMVWFIDIPRF
jgi:hypothetical protein